MYILKIFFPGAHISFPGERISRLKLELKNAAEVLASIPLLLQEHDGCERIGVFLDTMRLYDVDCKSDTLPVSPFSNSASAV
jgi:hypothetical protein